MYDEVRFIENVPASCLDVKKLLHKGHFTRIMTTLVKAVEGIDDGNEYIVKLLNSKFA